MTRYEKLLDRIQQSEIYFDEANDKVPAASLTIKRRSVIFFNEKAFETEAEKTVALAHEKGHCDSGAFYTVHTPFETRGRYERRAWKCAVMELIPFNELMGAVDACRTAEGISVHDLAEHFGLTPDFISGGRDLCAAWEEDTMNRIQNTTYQGGAAA